MIVETALKVGGLYRVTFVGAMGQLVCDRIKVWANRRPNDETLVCFLVEGDFVVVTGIEDKYLCKVLVSKNCQYGYIVDLHFRFLELVVERAEENEQ